MQLCLCRKKAITDLDLKAGLHCKDVAALANILPWGLLRTWLLFVQLCKTGTDAAKPNNSEVILHLQESDICHIVMGLIQPGSVKYFWTQEAKGNF